MRSIGYVCAVFWLWRARSSDLAKSNDRTECSRDQCSAAHQSSLLQMQQFAPQTIESPLVEDSDAAAPSASYDARRPMFSQYELSAEQQNRDSDAAALPADIDATPPSFAQYESAVEQRTNGHDSDALAESAAPEATRPFYTQEFTPSMNLRTKGSTHMVQHEAREMPQENDDSQERVNMDFDRSLAEESVESESVAAESEAAHAKSDIGTGAVSIGHCNPQCMWKCDSPKCDEICKPVCKAPRCETRCDGVSLKGCAMDCSQPHCAVLCPERLCPNKDNPCQACQTTCSEAMCKLKCPKFQPCKNVCETPKCEWSCEAPVKCPPPKCRMWCETPKSCRGSTYRSLPMLKAGQSSIKSFSAPQASEFTEKVSDRASTKPKASRLLTPAQEVSPGAAIQVPMVTAMYPESVNEDDPATAEPPRLQHRTVEMPML